MASPASAQLVTIQQVSTSRYLDAWEDDGHDFRAVIWTQQNNDSQLWRMTRVDGQVYTLQQVNTGRFLDAHEIASQDWNAVTRPAQNNNTQQWLIIDLGGGINTIQQVSSGRYLDAWEDAGHDYRAVTRPFQGNATQQWRITIVRYEFNVLPIDPGIFIPPVEPPAPPTVHSSGTFELASPLMVNVDQGNIALAGADIQYFAPNLTDLSLVPVGGAMISYTDGSQRDYAGCSAATFSTTPVPIASIAPGQYFCIKTNEGRISELRINSIGAILRVLSVDYTTWDAP